MQVHILCTLQDLMRLEEVKTSLHLQLSREPTMIEWAEAVGMTCRDLQSCINSGNRCRERMILANFRLVVHVAKQYQKKGLNIQDLLQVGRLSKKIFMFYFLINYPWLVIFFIDLMLLCYHWRNNMSICYLCCYIYRWEVWALWRAWVNSNLKLDVDFQPMLIGGLGSLLRRLYFKILELFDYQYEFMPIWLITIQLIIYWLSVSKEEMIFFCRKTYICFWKRYIQQGDRIFMKKVVVQAVRIWLDV